MAKSKKRNSPAAETVYKVVEVIGTSPKSWEDAAVNAVETAATTLRDLRIAEIVKHKPWVEIFKETLGNPLGMKNLAIEYNYRHVY